MRQRNYGPWAPRVARMLTIGVTAGALGACDSLLEVTLPHVLTEEAIQSAATSEVQVNSAIALFECGYTAYGLRALGEEGTMASIAGVFSGGHVYGPSAVTGSCDTGDTSSAWFDQIMGARGMLSTDPALLVPTAKGTVTSAFPVGRGIYDRIRNEFGVANVTNGERLSALAALYVAMSITHIGEFMCDIAFDGSNLVSPPAALQIAEDWVTNRALVHGAAVPGGSGFVLPFGITTSATANTGGTFAEAALALRARIRWARGDLTGAELDAASVLGTRSRFTQWVTRDAGNTRRNKIFYNPTAVGFSGILGLNTWWNPAGNRANNPATGAPWPTIIPFTGYKFLGIDPTTGRTLASGTNNIPVRYANETRGAGDAVENCRVTSSVGCVVGAVADSRVTHFIKQIQGPGRHEVPSKYTSENDDVPYMTWEELTLIRAEKLNMVDNTTVARTTAIGYVNGIRTAKSLPLIAGAYLTELTNGTNDQAEVRAMLLEERRREFYAEGGRFHSTGIQNTDLIWFPRLQGATPNSSAYQLGGSVRLLTDGQEYNLNEYLLAAGGPSARGTGCASLGPLPGAQVPLF